jgi:hypothetical protein
MTDSEWVRVIDFPSEAEASQAGARLLESGIVAVLEDETGNTSLAVQPGDVVRACEVLGVAAPATAEPVLPLDVPLSREEVRWRFPRERLGVFVAGYVAALLVLGVVVFFVVVWLLGGYDSAEIPEMPGVTQATAPP